MATTGVIDGALLLMYLDSVAVGSATTHTLTLQMATRNTTTKGSAGWETSASGVRNWSATGSGLLVFSDTLGYSQLLALIVNRTSVSLRLSSEVSGDKFWEGTAWLTDLSLDSPDNENSTYTYTFKGTGVLSEKSQT